MTDQGCARWQGELAMQALGRLEPDVEVALQAHLDGCADCRGEAAELAPLAGALAAASPTTLDEAEADRVPTALQESVLARLATEARADRRRSRRRAGVLAGALAGAAVAASAVVVTLTGGHAPVGRVVALAGSPGTQASITLSPSPSGTDVTLREHGQPVGRDFVVTVKSTSGSWWQAGSYHTSGATVRAQLTCAVAPSQITRVWVRDRTGATVLSAYVD